MQRLRYSRYFKAVIIVLDILIVAAVFLFLNFGRNVLQRDNIDQHVFIVILLSLFWMLLSSRTKLYNVERSLTYTNYLERLFTHIVVFILGIILLSKVTNNELLEKDKFTFAVVLFFILFFIKSLIFFALKYIRSQGKNHRNIMFLAENSSSAILKSIIEERKDYGYKIFDYPEQNIDIQNLKKFWKKNGIHTLYLPSENSIDKNLEDKIFNEAELCKVRISLIPNIIQNEFFSYELGYIESQPILSPIKFPLEFLGNHLIKRVFDILFSAFILLTIGIWLIPLVSILIVLNSKGPVFFRQKRYGFHDEVFTCWKFRTMYFEPYPSTKTTEINDQRITSVGKFLRKTSIDEFPQFFNVLLGDMSVVGPRPHMLLVDEFYKPKIGRYSVRSLVKPGITGLAQVNGLRGDHGDMGIEMKKRVLADSFYVKNWSFSLDIIIILKTVLLVLAGDKNAR
ncbi:exopolysaccharide biosynthesis polyprenyl glycosylphosphotransferase [uncultured Chryseobacterium sp.]|uniref:exopolysaccharide biosynthesis polyprenyl glycosylphosphotransferase n=1 Tax=uncultured Chryseobacterium sp. TaxID=259322 RepID=UPI0026112BAA|nr:exopolysaccharide biosynthesis polyprenyl glycosylphosphotransferase [uncultured Chryseobacterium sp.]